MPSGVYEGNLLVKGMTPWNKIEDVFVKCEVCPKTVKVDHNRKGKARFCSRPCYAQSLRGRKHTQEHKEKIAEGIKGEKHPMWDKKHTEIVRKKMSATHQGISQDEWNGFTSKERTRIMKSKDYVLWRTAVFMRDDYTCQGCDTKGGSLQADHIKPYALFPELRLAIDNGRTLCVECHRKTDTWGNKAMYRATNAMEGGVSRYFLN
jgi:hypothetical protein